LYTNFEVRLWSACYWTLDAEGADGRLLGQDDDENDEDFRDDDVVDDEDDEDDNDDDDDVEIASRGVADDDVTEPNTADDDDDDDDDDDGEGGDDTDEAEDDDAPPGESLMRSLSCSDRNLTSRLCHVVDASQETKELARVRLCRSTVDVARTMSHPSLLFGCLPLSWHRAHGSAS